MQSLGHKFDQRFIGLAIDRWRRQPDFQRIAIRPGKFGFFGTRLNVQGQRDTTIAGDAKPLAHKNISKACNNKMATSGDRSMPPISGMKRRIGSSSGRVNCCAGADKGE